MNDVYPVFAKRWYGYGTSDWYWQLFSIHEDAASAQRTVDNLTAGKPSRARASRTSVYEEGRKKEFMYQRNMVI